MNRSTVGAALACAVASLPLPGCRSSGQCPSNDFSWSFQVSGPSVDAVMAGPASRRCSLLCEEEAWYQIVAIDEIDRCRLELDPEYERAYDTGEPDFDRPGSVVRCSGEATPICKGRRPTGLVAAAPRGHDPLGVLLAGFARDERTAVVAFEQLASRLIAWNAPRALVARCRKAADQERLHDRLLTAEAVARGVEVPDFHVDRRAPDLVTLAHHNAVEGCANEAAAALLAHLIARTAPTRSSARPSRASPGTRPTTLGSRSTYTRGSGRASAPRTPTASTAPSPTRSPRSPPPSPPRRPGCPGGPVRPATWPVPVGCSPRRSADPAAVASDLRPPRGTPARTPRTLPGSSRCRRTASAAPRRDRSPARSR